MKDANSILDRLYQNHFETVFLSLQSFGDAEERTQAAFFKLSDMLYGMSLKELDDWESAIENMTGYLIRLAKNKAILNTNRNKQLSGIIEGHHQLYGITGILGQEDIGRGTAWITLENGLSVKDFGVLVKKNVEDKTYGEVAEELGLGSPANARLVHFRARNRAKALLTA